MSIYLAKRKLVEIMEKSKLKFDIPMHISKSIATLQDKHLYYEYYSEEALEKLAKKGAIVDIEFWNLNYCSYKNIDRELADSFIENLNIVIDDKKSFSNGTVIMLILLHQLLADVYTIDSAEVFEEYLDEIKISKKVIKNFLINIDYCLPLTENFLILILKTFDLENIYDFIFKKCNNFGLDEFKTVMENYEVKDINLLSYYIYENFEGKEFLQYISASIDLFDDKIDTNDVIYYNPRGNDPYIGYYLLTFPITEKNEECYYYVMKKYVNKYGCLNLIVKGEEEAIEKRIQEIKSSFELF